MKKIASLIFILCIIITSCKNKVTNNNVTAEANNIDTAIASVVENIPQILGSYVGAFGDNKITVLISKATKDSVRGRSIVGGFDRPFEGVLSVEKNIVKIVAKEPGDDSHDGTFNLIINKDSLQNLKGDWTPFKTTEKIKSKSFSLNKKSFSYLQDVGNYPQASKWILHEDEVMNLSKSQLEQMRNEIYARHGYCFTRKATRQQFEIFDWYIPNSTNIKKDITDIEKKNITLIKKFEKYADDYGDDFGR